MERGTTYYVMDLLQGADLARLAPLPPSEACRVLRDIASALALLHSRRFVHRDVSPTNVRLTAQGTAKLIDLGALSPVDVDLSDPESLGLLVAIALDQQRAHVTPIMSGLARLSRDRAIYARLAASTREIALKPLRAEAVGEPVQAICGAVPNSLRLAGWLYVQAAGNAARTLELIRLLLQRGLIRYTVGTFTLPHDVTGELADVDLGAAVLARLDDLAEEADVRALRRRPSAWVSRAWRCGRCDDSSPSRGLGSAARARRRLCAMS